MLSYARITSFQVLLVLLPNATISHDSINKNTWAGPSDLHKQYSIIEKRMQQHLLMNIYISVKFTGGSRISKRGV